MNKETLHQHYTAAGLTTYAEKIDIFPNHDFAGNRCQCLNPKKLLSRWERGWGEGRDK